MATIVCFGDSNTWGCPPFDVIALPPTRYPKLVRWTKVMERELGDDVDVVEEGLSGRTTVYDDAIEGAHKNGMRTLPAVIETNVPLELLIIMLGTNDFKIQFGATAFNSARGVLSLIQQVRGMYALAEQAPEILVVTPPMVSERAEKAFWGDAVKRSEGHAYYLAQVAERTGCFHFDANEVASVAGDGVHLDEKGHLALGRALAKKCARYSGSRKMTPLHNM